MEMRPPGRGKDETMYHAITRCYHGRRAGPQRLRRLRNERRNSGQTPASKKRPRDPCTPAASFPELARVFLAEFKTFHRLFGPEYDRFQASLQCFKLVFSRIRSNSIEFALPDQTQRGNFPRNRQKSPETARNEKHRKSQSFAEKCTVVAV